MKGIKIKKRHVVLFRNLQENSKGDRMPGWIRSITASL